MIIRQSFRISFNNAELWNGCFDGLGDSEELIRQKLADDMKEIRRPSSPSLILLNVYGTVLANDLTGFILEQLASAQPYVKKVAVSGLEWKYKNTMIKYIKKRQGPLPFAIAFFDDLQKAKEWLI